MTAYLSKEAGREVVEIDLLKGSGGSAGQNGNRKDSKSDCAQSRKLVNENPP